MAVELGVGYVSIVPSAKGFQARLEKLIAGVPAVIDVKADTSKAAAAIQRQLGSVSTTVAVKASLDQQSAGAVKSAVSKIDVTPDTRGFFDKIRSAFTRQSATVDVAPNTSNFASKLRSQVGDQTSLGRTMGETAGEGLTSSLTSAAKRAVAAVAAVFAGQQLLNVGKTAFSTAADFEQTEVAFKGLLGNADLAEQKLDELQKFAAATPFNFPQLSDAARKLLAFGFSAEEIIPTMEKLGNAAAALGASDVDINLVVRALGQISTKGRVQLEELNQIAEAFPGANPIPALAASVNKSVPEFTAALSLPGGALAAFGLTGEQAVKVILDGFTEINGAAGAMDRQSETLKGSLSTLADTLRIVAIQSLKPFLPGIALFIREQVVPAVETFGKRVPGIIRAVVGTVSPILRKLADGFRIFFKELDPSTATTKGFHNLNDVFAHLGDIVRKVRDGITIFKETLDRTVDANPGIHNLNDIFAHVADFVSKASDKLRAFGHIVKTAVDAFRAGFNGQVGAAGLIGTIETIGAKARQFFQEDIPNFVNDALGAFHAFVDGFKDGFKDGVTNLDNSGLQGRIEDIAGQVGALAHFLKTDVPDAIGAFVDGFRNGFDDIDKGTKFEKFEHFGDTVKSIVDTIKDNKDIFGAIAGAITGFATALVVVSKLSPVFSVLSGVLGSLGTVVGILTSPLGIVVGLLAGLAAAAFFAYKKFTPFRAAVDSVVQTFKRAGFGAAVDEAGTQFGRLFEIVKPKLIEFRDSVFGWIKDHLSGAFSWIKDHWKEILIGGALGGGVGAILGPFLLDPIGSWIKDTAAPWLKDKFTTEWLPAFTSWITDSVVPFLKEKLPGIVDAIIGFLQENEPKVLDGFNTLADRLFDWVTDTALPKLQEKLPGIFEALMQWANENLPEWGRQLGLLALDAVGRITASIIEHLPDLFLTIPAELAAAGLGIIAGIIAGAIGPDATQKLEDITTGIIAFVSGLPAKISGAAVGMWDGLYDAFKSAINFIIRGWNSLSFDLPEIDTHIPGIGKVGGFHLAVPPIAELAGGGVFTSKTTGLFSLAETPAARPEIVTPQKLLAQTFRKELATVGAGSGGGVQFGDIVVNGAQASPSSIADAVFAKAGWLHFTGRREL